MTARSFVRRAALALCVVLAACGGGGGGGSGGPTVNNIGSSSPRYASPAQITVQGRNLRGGSGIDIEVKGACENLTRETTLSNDDAQRFTCTIRGVGEIKFAVYDVDSKRYLGELTVFVPAPQVAVSTSMGNFTLELDPVAAPQTVQHFLGYVNAGFYNPATTVGGVIVHRVIKGIGIETGGFTRGYRRKDPTRAALAVEATGLRHLRGTVAMSPSRRAAGSVDAQWFVNLGDNTDLDAANPQLPVFGRVVAGLDVADAIGNVETGIDSVNGFVDAPVTEILLTRVEQVR